MRRRPEGALNAGDLEMVTTDVPQPAAGEAQVEAVLVSIDPYLRLSMDVDQPIGGTLFGGGIGRVVASRSPDLAEGQFVRHDGGMRERFNASTAALTPIFPEAEIPLEAYLSVLGGVGLVAWGGLFVTGALKDGEQVFVSAAAGATGSLAAQFAKLHGCYVVGSAGAAEKVRWLREDLRLDAAINYRTEDLEAALAAATPNGIDVYFDNVGGAHLDAALGRMNDFGRVPVCGMISTYDGDAGPPIRNLKRLMYGRIRLEGFLYRDLAPLEPRFLAEVTPLVSTGRIAWRQTVWEGFERIPEALLGLIAGRNTGKTLVRVQP